ncbi:MAG: ceramidase domain-containing protein [Flavobacteriaceae bacterium]
MIFFQQTFPNDTGPIYQETIEGRLPVEPFNTFSNLIFIAILIYFIVRIYKQPKNHVFLWICIPIIFVSWVGGTIFHATRSHQVWLVMDWLPIMIVCLLGIIYFIGKIRKKWWERLLIFAGVFLLTSLPRLIELPNGFRISMGYAITAITVLTPFFWYAYLQKWENVKDLILGMVIFGIAVTFRTLDTKVELLPMGTHWLWHTFGGVAVFFLLLYIYKDDLKLAKASKPLSS